MAISVIGGLLSSTVLSLVFVPAVFAVLDDVANLTWRIFGRFVGPSDETDADDAAKPVRADNALARPSVRPIAAE